jgi:DNA-binding transcriptional LysR family regulator
MEDMDAEALRTFLEIHRAGGITRAAAALHRSQPAVSRRLALLEQELGVALFERIRGGVALTEAGKALLPYAEAGLAILADAEAAVRALRSEETGALRVAIVGTLASSHLTSVLRRFAKRHPRVELGLRTATSREVSELVRRADVTLGLRYARDPAPELRCETLFAERMVLAAAADHPLAGARRVAAQRLADESWIAFPHDPERPEAAAAQVQRAIDAVGVPESRVLRIDSLTAQKRLIEAGFGIGLVPESSLHEERAKGALAVLDVRGLEVSIPVVLVTRRKGFLGAAARTLVAELRKAAGARSV